MAALEINCCVSGYHIRMSQLQLVKILLAHENVHERDRYAAIIKDRSIIGHIPQKLSHVCSLFLQRGGSITCLITRT